MSINRKGNVIDEKWQRLGSTVTHAIILAQIWAVICFVLFIVIVILVANYLKKSKQEKETGNSEYKNSKKYILMRIGIIIVVILFALLVVPFIFI